MSNHIFKFKHNHNIELLKVEFSKLHLQKFSKLNDKWLRTFTVGDYGQSLQHTYSDLVQDMVYVAYYHQLAGDEVKRHKDLRCKCKINIRLSDDTAAVVFGEEKHYYDCALLNVGEYEHYVEKSDKDRILFSIVFVNTDFEMVKKVLT